MNERLLLLILIFLGGNNLLAQRAVTGIITDDRGIALQGVQILAKGTNVETASDKAGKYKLKVPRECNTLVASLSGFETTEMKMGNYKTIHIVLKKGLEVPETAVTALDRKREERTLGYALQKIKGNDLSLATEQNLVSALSGKVAGVQVVTASAASLGGTANIKIRGINGLYGSAPLFVVDGTPVFNSIFDDNLQSDAHRGVDYGNMAQDINPSDIEDISILKGPAAAALYGQRAAGGAILINTKKGQRNQGIKGSFNSSLYMDDAYIVPSFQNEYAGGYNAEFPTFNFNPNLHPAEYAAFDGQQMLDYAADESWGPRMEGQLYRPWWSWYPNTEDFGKQIPLEAQPNNTKDFFNSGNTFTNNLALSGGTKKHAFRFSYTNINQKGIIPNSQLQRNHLGVSTFSQLSKKWLISTNYHLALTKGSGRPTYGYLDNNPLLSLHQWFQRQLNLDRLRDYKNTDGTFRSWNLLNPVELTTRAWDSPFFGINENLFEDKRSNYFGNITLEHRFGENWSLIGAARIAKYNQRVNRQLANSQDLTFDATDIQEIGSEKNLDLTLNYQKRWGNIGLEAFWGGNWRKNSREFSYHTSEGISDGTTILQGDTLSSRPELVEGLYEKKVRGVFGAANFSYRNFAFLDITLRNDWSSEWDMDNNSNLYPSISASFVFSELVPIRFLSFGKVRANLAKTGMEIDAYQRGLTYQPAIVNTTLPGFEVPQVFNNAALSAPSTTGLEFGVDLRFWKNRLGMDLTYYHQDSKNHIMGIASAGGTHFTAFNAGHIQSHGVELTMTAIPIQKKHLQWDVVFQLAKNQSTVVELADGIDSYTLDAWGWGDFSLQAEVGEAWGTMRGNGYKIHEASGLPIIEEDGTYVVEEDKNLGSVLPELTGGLKSTLSWRGFSLGAFFDFQRGGQFHSISKMFSAYSGLSEETAGLNDKGNPVRDSVEEGGGIKVEGVLADGTPHIAYMDAQKLYKDTYFAFHEKWIYDASYFKLREASLSYRLSEKLLQKSPIENLTVALYGRNIWLISSNVEGIDPSEIPAGTNGLVFQENGILPSVRSVGLKVNVGF